MEIQKLTASITAWMEKKDNNAIGPNIDHAAFDTPLVGCAAGNDPIFFFFKEDIGPDFFWTPEEAFALAFPNESAPADELSVVSWILPQTERTRKAHRQETAMPSIEWSRGRHYGEMVNENLRRFVVNVLFENEIDACAPALLPEWSRQLSPKYGFASNWSERHIAHACGLGTFGLSDGLITPAGKAVRVGSVIARHAFQSTPRPYEKHNEWCLFHSTGKCRACIKRCPVGAISEAGHDKHKCKEYIRSVTAKHVEREQLGFRVNSCGLCQTKVPCEHRNPTARRSSSS